MRASRILHRHSLALALAAALLAGSQAAPAAAGDWITVTGEAAILNGDHAAAKDAALQHAFRAAVEQGVGTLIASDTMTRNYAVINDTIFTKARGYVRRWNILNDYARGGRYIVEVECEVSGENIKHDLIALNILQAAKDNPRVMILLPATHEELKIVTRAAENTLVRVFVENDFEVVDQAQVEAIRQNEEVVAALNGDDAMAITLGDRFGAEVIILGEAKSVYAASTYGMKSGSATVSVRALNCDTGKIIGSSTRRSTKAHLDDRIAGDMALEAAAEQAAEEILAFIAKRWSADIADSLRVQILVTGIDFGQLQRMKRALAGLPGVKAVNQRSFITGAAKLDVDFRGKTERLAEVLYEADLGFAPDITGMTANKIEMRVGGV